MNPEFEKLDAYWLSVRERIDGKLREMITDEENPDVRSILEAALMDGKRIRATLVLLVAEALGGDMEEALGYAALIESVHSGSLVLDDVMDNDAMRRKNPSLWRYLQDAPFMAKSGREITMLAAEGLVSRAMMQIRSVPALKVIVKAMTRLFKGFVIEAARGGPKGYDEYIEMIDNKTGSLFVASALLGFVTSSRYEEGTLKDVVEEYARACGIAFQLADDVLDQQVHPGLKAPHAEIVKWVRIAEQEADRLSPHPLLSLVRTFPSWMVNKKLEVGT